MKSSVDSPRRTAVHDIIGALGKMKAHSLNLPRLLKFSAIGILWDH